MNVDGLGTQECMLKGCVSRLILKLRSLLISVPIDHAEPQASGAIPYLYTS